MNRYREIHDQWQTLNWKNFYGICHAGIYISAIPLVGRLLWTPCGHRMSDVWKSAKENKIFTYYKIEITATEIESITDSKPLSYVDDNPNCSI